MAQKFAGHELVHEREESARRSRTRWVAGFCVAAGTMLTGVLALVADIATRVR